MRIRSGKQLATRVLMTTALAGALTLPLCSPAHAAYDTANGCYASIPLIECSTSPAINPHSSASWLWANVTVSGPACYVDWWIYDTWNATRPKSGSIWVAVHRSFFINGLNTSHRYQLVLKTYNCSVAVAQLRNWT